MIVPLSRTRWSRRLATTTAAVTTDPTATAIDLIIAPMAITGMVIGPTMVMGVAGATKIPIVSRG